MKKTISELYYFDPLTSSKALDVEEFRKITAEFLECCNNIEEFLGEENKELFRKYENLGKKISDSLCADAFEKGFSLSTRLTFEALESK